MKKSFFAIMFAMIMVSISSCATGNYNLSSRTNKNHHGCHGASNFTGSMAWTRTSRN